MSRAERVGQRVVVWRGLRSGRRGVVVEARQQSARVLFDEEGGATTVPWSVLEDEAAHDAAGDAGLLEAVAHRAEHEART